MASLATRIRLARHQAGCSQSLLAQRLGVGRSAVANWECGKAHPSTQHLLRLAATTDVSLAWLGTGEGPMATPATRAPQGAAGPLSEQEHLLLSAFRAASEARQPHILRVALSLAATTAVSLSDLLSPIAG